MKEDKSQAVYWIDLDQIDPNPYQPRHYFNPEALRELSESIRRFGVLQPIVVTRNEQSHDGGLVVRYEIIAGERRFRASKLAGLTKIPAVVRENEQSAQEKLELAILENLQREDLNPVDKARSFAQLVNEFGLKHAEVASHLGKSREYVSNSMRILALPTDILDGLSAGKISEGHTRPLLMLKDRPEEQKTLYQEIVSGGMTVRAAEKIARGIAKEKQRKVTELDPEMKEIKNKLEESLGTRVKIDKHEKGGKLTIDFFSREDLKKLLAVVGTTSVGDTLAQVEQEVQEEVVKTDLYNQPIDQQQEAKQQPIVSSGDIDEVHDLDMHIDEQVKQSSLQDEINRLAMQGSEDTLDKQIDYAQAVHSEPAVSNPHEQIDHFQTKQHVPNEKWSFSNNTGAALDGELGGGFRTLNTPPSNVNQFNAVPNQEANDLPETEPLSEADMISDTQAFAEFAQNQKIPQANSEIGGMSLGGSFLDAKQEREEERDSTHASPIKSSSDFMVGGDEFTI